MKKNTNFNISKLELIILPIIIIVCALFIGIFLNKNIEIKQNFNLAETNVDFIIQTPSQEQVNSIEALDNVVSITPYLYTAATLCKNNKIIQTEFFVVMDEKDISKTLFSDSLMREKSTQTFHNPLYIDSIYAQKNNIDLNDEITITVVDTKIKYNVKAIYNSDGRHPNGFVFAIAKNDTKSVLDESYGNQYIYSGAFIDSNNVVETNQYLDTYVPEGDLKTRDDFASDELYQAYLDLRNDTNWKLTTFRTADYLQENHNRYDKSIANNMLLEYIIIVIASLLLIGFILARSIMYAKTEVKKDLKNNYALGDEKKMFCLYFIKIGILTTVLTVISIVCRTLILQLAIFTIVNIVELLLPLFFLLLSYCFIIYFIKRKYTKIVK